MTELLRTWLLGVVCAAIIVTLGECIAPEGGAKRICRLAGGLVLLLVAISPLIRMDEEQLHGITEGYRVDSEEYSEALASQQEYLYEAIIAENTAAYILDKAEELGMSCQIEVTILRDENGVPYPGSVTVEGGWTQSQRAALSQILETDLGIAISEQLFEEIPT